MSRKRFFGCLLLSLFCLAVEALKVGSCGSNTCGSNGECHSGPFNNHSQPTFWCRCKDGFGGEFCERKCQNEIDCDSGKERCVFDEDMKAKCVCKDCDSNGVKLPQKPNCPSGFGGENCSLPGWCYPDLCQNGGKCTGSTHGARCICLEGFKGQRCELDVNECHENAKACGSRSTCINTIGAYMCVCPQGFSAPDCLKRANDSAVEFKKPACFLEVNSRFPDGGSMYCQNGGVCEKTLSKCHCPPGYSGSTCELSPGQSEDLCLVNSCGHGTCYSFPGGFQCICDDGYSGANCQDGQDNCLNNKCEAGSKCINGIDSYYCDCPEGKTGQFCEKVDCTSIPGICNHGVCLEPHVESAGSLECLCDPGYEGELCDQDKNECLSEIVCLNNGTCVNLPGSFRCECPRGYAGKWCNELVDTCAGVNCENGGTCMMTSDRSPICQCKNGFIGDRCQQKCGPGIGGVRCDLKLDDVVCSRNGGNCFNGGKCIDKLCICPPDFTGNQCEKKRNHGTSLSEKLCNSDPCMNNATCIDVDAHIGYVCICQQGFEGDICERTKDLCVENPCANGGSCRQNGEGFRCECLHGFFGQRCEQEKKLICNERTCNNRGTCISDGKSARCECSYGFTGPQCAEKINLENFYNKENFLRSVCERNKCKERANDGNCDAECNLAACKFDGGDCSGKREPFSRCNYGNLCADLFSNGVCNQACNNEACLYDGMDCMPGVVRCPTKIREYCAERFANGICDAECNTDGCGFDGGDCANKTEATILTDIRITVKMAPSEFQENGGKTLMEISSALRATVRIQRDEEGPLVFEWDGENESGRVKMNEKKLAEQHVLSSSIRRIRRALGTEHQGVVVYLEVEENCVKGKCLYTDAQSVVDQISARLAKKGVDSFGAPISEALLASPPRRSKDSGSLKSTILLIGVGCTLSVVLAGTLTVHEKRSRKRRMINAPVWIPPMENEDKNRRHSSQHSLLDPSGFYEAKRHRQDVALQNQYHQFYPTYGNGYMNNYSSQQSVDESQCLLHLQAAGPDAITEPLTEASVNFVDSIHKRSVLHYLAVNSAEKPEELIVQEVRRCIEVGAEVNLRDCDENTPLMLAVRSRRVRLAIILMSAGADPTIYNKLERNALHEAAVNCDLKMMEILLTDKRLIKDLEELDRNGMTVLMKIATTEGPVQVAMAQLLISKGAKIDSDGSARKDSDIYRGRTALHYAALVGNRPMVEFLVAPNQNANKDKQDEAGQTPIMLAAKEGHEHIVFYLITQGASIEAVDSLDRTARQLAESNNYHKIVDIFDRYRPELHAPMEMGRHHQQQSQIAQNSRKTARPAYNKAVRKQSTRAKKEDSRDSTHLTPPPSDGSTSSPSPQHFHQTTPTSMNYMSPEYLHEIGSAEAFQPQCTTLPNGEMWYTASPTYPPMPSEPMMRHSEPAYQYY